MLKKLCLSLLPLFSLAATPTPPKPMETLRLGLLYTGDSYPIFHAHKQGYFKEAGLQVELVDFLSAAERDQALQSGSIDGATNDLISSSLMYQSKQNIQVVALTLGDDLNVRRVALVSSKPKVKLPEDLKGQQIAVSFNTIIEYLTDRLLEKKGIDPNQVEKVAIANVPMRLTLLREKKLAFAMLPEPLASMAVVEGNSIAIEDSGDPYAHAVFVFRKDALQKKPLAVQAFKRGLDKAVKEINQKPEAFRSSIAERCRVADAVKHSFFLYKYAFQKQPSQFLFDDVQKWLVQKKKLKQPIAYQDLIANISETPSA